MDSSASCGIHATSSRIPRISTRAHDTGGKPEPYIAAVAAPFTGRAGQQAPAPESIG